MHHAYYVAMLRLMWHDRKNQLALLLGLIATLLFCFYFNAQTLPPEKVLPKTLRTEIQALKVAVKHGGGFDEHTTLRIDEDVLAGVAGGDRDHLLTAYSAQLQAYERQLTQPDNYSYPAVYYQATGVNADPLRDAHYGVQKALARMDYLTMHTTGPIPLAVLNQQTFLQTLVRLWDVWLPVGALILTALLCCDVVTADRRHASVTATLPLRPGTQLTLKALAVLTVVGGAVLVACGVVAAVTIPRYGLGWGVGAVASVNAEPVFVGLSQARYLAECAALTGLACWVMIRFSQWLQRAFNSAALALGAPLLLLATPGWYFLRDTGLVRRWPLQLPMSYTAIGRVVSGQQAFLYGNGQVTIGRAVLILAAWGVVIEGLLWATGRLRRVKR